jgi:hypothetical protein
MNDYVYVLLHVYTGVLIVLMMKSLQPAEGVRKGVHLDIMNNLRTDTQDGPCHQGLTLVTTVATAGMAGTADCGADSLRATRHSIAGHARHRLWAHRRGASPAP